MNPTAAAELPTNKHTRAKTEAASTLLEVDLLSLLLRLLSVQKAVGSRSKKRQQMIARKRHILAQCEQQKNSLKKVLVPSKCRKSNSSEKKSLEIIAFLIKKSCRIIWQLLLA